MRAALPDGGRFLLRAVRIGIFLVLLTPLVVGSQVIFPFIVGKAVYARAVIEIAFACWVVLVLFHRQHRPAWSWTLFAFAVWLVVSWIAGALGVSPARSMWSTYERMHGVFDLAHWFAFSLVAASAFRRVADWRLLFGVNVVLAAAACAAGLTHHYGLVDIRPFGDSPISAPFTFERATYSAWTDWINSVRASVQSTLGNPAYMGVYATVNAVIGAALVVHSSGPSAGGHAVRPHFVPWVTRLWALLVVIILWTLWQSGARGALAGLGAASVTCAACAVRGRSAFARRAGGGVLAVLATAAMLLVIARTTTVMDPIVESSSTLRRIVTVGLDEAATGERVRYAGAGLRAFLDRPVFGWGPENFLAVWGRYGGGNFSYSDRAHNQLIEELTTKGAVGLLAYLTLWAVMASVLIRAVRRQSGRDRRFLCVIGAALAAYFVQNLFLFDTPATLMLFSLLAAFTATVETRLRTPASADDDAPRGRPAGAGGRRAGLIASAVVAVSTITSLAVLNVRAYSAATALLDATQTTRPWSDRLDDFIRSIDGFPGLANHARMHLAAGAVDLFARMSDEDFGRTVKTVTIEAGRGRAEEPQNWRFSVVMAVFYQLAATREPYYLDLAKRHVDRAVELAPRLREVGVVVREQERREASAASGPR